MESIREKVMPEGYMNKKNNQVMSRKLGINNNQLIRMGINNKPIKKRIGM
jgi:hypothetical protein